MALGCLLDNTCPGGRNKLLVGSEDTGKRLFYGSVDNGSLIERRDQSRCVRLM